MRFNAGERAEGNPQHLSSTFSNFARPKRKKTDLAKKLIGPADSRLLLLSAFFTLFSLSSVLIYKLAIETSAYYCVVYVLAIVGLIRLILANYHLIMDREERHRLLKAAEENNCEKSIDSATRTVFEKYAETYQRKVKSHRRPRFKIIRQTDTDN